MGANKVVQLDHVVESIYCGAMWDYILCPSLHFPIFGGLVNRCKKGAFVEQPHASKGNLDREYSMHGQAVVCLLLKILITEASEHIWP